MNNRSLSVQAFGGRPAVLGIVFILAMGLLLSGCSQRTELTEIDEEKIPEPVRYLVEVNLRFEAKRGENPRNLKWRAVDEREGYTFVACTYERTRRVPGPRPDDPVKEWDEIVAMWIEHRTDDRPGGGFSGGSVDELPPREPFKVAGIGYGGLPGLPHLVAYGWCTDPKVEKIVAITSSGTEVETSPVGGFWYVRYDGNAEGETFVRVKALSARGEVLREASIPTERPPSEPN